MSTRGFYFLANDTVYEQAVAFLNSFREHNPDARLCLIPYNDRCDRVSALQSSHGFEIYPDPDYLRQCDRYSLRYFEHPEGAFRKLGIWQGPFDIFAYVDVDTLVLRDLSFAFEYLDHAEIVTSNSDLPETRKWVWHDSIDTTALLSPRQIRYATNTGFIVSTRGIVTADWIEEKVEEGLSLIEHMNLGCKEQPFLNYLIVTSGATYSSFSYLEYNGLSRNTPLEHWAGHLNAKVDGDRVILPTGSPAFLLHWAGYWQFRGEPLDDIPYGELWRYYRNRNPAIPEYPDPATNSPAAD